MSASPDLLRSLLGLFPFDAKKGYGSFVIFRLTSTPDLPKEDAYFRVDMCTWRIRISGDELAHSESSDADITSAVSTLNGKRFESIVLNSCLTPDGIFHAADLFFEGRIKMALYQYDDPPADYAIFVARNPAGLWVSYLSDGRIKTEQSTSTGGLRSGGAAAVVPATGGEPEEPA